jgi:rhodanese-related sulfurtransferase
MKFKNIVFLLLMSMSTFSQARELETLIEPTEIVSNLVSQYQLQEVDFDYIKQVINKGTRNSAKAILIDTRPESKYKKGTIPTSLNIPDTKFEEYYLVLDGLAKDRELIVFCEGYNCTKSAIVAQKLKEKGHSNVKVYLAGEPQWNKYSYLEIDTSTIKSYQERNSALLVDSRAYVKYLEETIPGAISIPDLNMNKLMGRFPIDKKEDIVIFCEDYTCSKANNIANRLISLDYENVYVYAGGLLLWKESGLDTIISTKANIKDKKEQSQKKERQFKSKMNTKNNESNTNDAWYKKN